MDRKWYTEHPEKVVEYRKNIKGGRLMTKKHYQWTTNEINEMYRRYQELGSMKKIAEEYGLTKQRVSILFTGKKPIRIPIKENAEKIFNEHLNGKSYKELAVEYNTTQSYILSVLVDVIPDFKKFREEEIKATRQINAKNSNERKRKYYKNYYRENSEKWHQRYLEKKQRKD